MGSLVRVAEHRPILGMAATLHCAPTARHSVGMTDINVAIGGVPGLGAALHAGLRFLHLPGWAVVLIIIALIVLVRVAMQYQRRHRK